MVDQAGNWSKSQCRYPGVWAVANGYIGGVTTKVVTKHALEVARTFGSTMRSPEDAAEDGKGKRSLGDDLENELDELDGLALEVLRARDAVITAYSYT